MGAGSGIQNLGGRVGNTKPWGQGREYKTMGAGSGIQNLGGRVGNTKPWG